MALSGIKAVLFDLDETLFPTALAHARGLDAARRALPRAARAGFARRYALARAAVKRRLGPVPAARSRLLYFKEMDARAALAMNAAYEGACAGADVSAARRVAARLAGRYTLGVVTNQVCSLQLRKMARVDPRGRWFKFLLTSEEAGVEKPGARIYAEACRRAGCRPSQALMVGDDREHDVRGAVRAGLRAAWLKPSGAAPAGVLRLRSLDELPALLGAGPA
jgi:putative hydrolase of the HAD superfamily